ncbi:MAG: phosphatidate cytidylyltransferase [Ignavibacteria bacterium]|nr:phosphatidate cytidylyltransferase [Ignavibacteria bacterium]
MSNLAARVIVAVVAVPGILLLAYLGGYFWFLFVAAVFIAATVEYARMCRAKGAWPQTASIVVGGLGLLAAFLHERLGMDAAALTGGQIPLPLQWQAIVWVSLLFVIGVLTAELFRDKDSALLNAATTFLGMFYLGLCLGAAVGIREIFSPAEFPVSRMFGTAFPDTAQLAQLSRWGGAMTIAVLASIWLCDTAAYFGGKAMGRHKLFERVSPKKTWEGAVWGFAGAVGTMAAAQALALPFLSVVDALVIGAMVGTIGQIGDLVESLLKRDAGVKDSSALLPGHGGVFDRFDSLIFVSPALFLYLDFVVFA